MKVCLSLVILSIIERTIQPILQAALAGNMQ
jgi:hypothetical protein